MLRRLGVKICKSADDELLISRKWPEVAAKGTAEMPVHSSGFDAPFFKKFFFFLIDFIFIFNPPNHHFLICKWGGIGSIWSPISTWNPPQQDHFSGSIHSTPSALFGMFWDDFGMILGDFRAVFGMLRDPASQTRIFPGIYQDLFGVSGGSWTSFRDSSRIPGALKPSHSNPTKKILHLDLSISFRRSPRIHFQAPFQDPFRIGSPHRTTSNSQI